MATKKYINLLQSHEPLMDSGDYEITVQETLTVTNTVNEVFEATKKKFSVFGERYFLEPGSVHSVYPPMGSLGEHSNTFPHLILNRSTLPWERSMDGGRDGIWLALLLFDEKETPKVQTVLLGDLISSIGADPELGDGPADQPVTVIDVKRELLEKIMPRRADLDFTAHSRRETGNAERENVQVIGPERAVVIGNRLPKANELSTVHLVSIENRFANDGEFDYGNAGPNDLIRLVTLKSWSFSSVNPKFSLFGMLEHLNRAPSILSKPYLNDAVLNLNLSVNPITDRSIYGFEVTEKDTRLEEDRSRFFGETGFLSVEVPDSPIDADTEDPQLDPFPEPTEFSIAVELKVFGPSEANSNAILGKEENGKYKPSMWYIPSIRGIEYKVTGEDGTEFSGEIPGLIQDQVFTRIIWVKKGSEFHFYENGRLAHTAEAPARIFTNDSSYFIGKADESTLKFFGHMKQFRIFRRALTAGEIQDIFTHGELMKKPAINDRLSKGMLPLPHHFRKGQNAASWYRGPFSVRTINPGFNLPATVADELNVFDQKTGMFDVSYSAAWQLGRLMALEDRKFSLDLFSWKKQFSIRRKQESQANKSFLSGKKEVGVKLFTQTDFKGTQVTIYDNWSPAFGSPGNLNDKINSIDVPPGWEVEIFEHANYAGVSQVISGRWSATAGDTFWRNKISTIKVASPLEQSIRGWMKKLHVLQNVPFHYLVPEASFLPNESLRFFHIDPTWVRCLKDGAASIGRTTSADMELDKIENLANDPIPTMSGFFLRSELVAGYPGLQIAGYPTKLDDGSNPSEDDALPIARMERLSDNILLCIFEGEVRTVDLFQKPDVLHFGLDSDGVNFAKQLRLSNGASLPEEINGQVNPHASIQFSTTDFHDFDDRVLNFDQMAATLKDALLNLPTNQRSQNDIDEFTQFTSADFAMEMMEGAERVRFVKE